MNLKLTKKAIYRLEKEKDFKLGELQKMQDPEQFKFSTLIDLIWAGQLHNNPALTVDEVIDDVDFSNPEQYMEPIAQAVEEAFGDIVPDKEEDAEQSEKK